MKTENKKQKLSTTDKAGVSFNPLLSDSANFDAIWQENNYKAEVSIIRENKNCKGIYLVKGAFGEGWVLDKNLHFR